MQGFFVTFGVRPWRLWYNIIMILIKNGRIMTKLTNKPKCINNTMLHDFVMNRIAAKQATGSSKVLDMLPGHLSRTKRTKLWLLYSAFANPGKSATYISEQAHVSPRFGYGHIYKLVELGYLRVINGKMRTRIDDHKALVNVRKIYITRQGKEVITEAFIAAQKDLVSD